MLPSERSGAQIFYVTNRSHGYWQSTLRNLTQMGFPVDEDGSNLLSLGKCAMASLSVLMHEKLRFARVGLVDRPLPLCGHSWRAT
jgi:predicted secreted acid phosphatase